MNSDGKGVIQNSDSKEVGFDDDYQIEDNRSILDDEPKLPEYVPTIDEEIKSKKDLFDKIDSKINNSHETDNNSNNEYKQNVEQNLNTTTKQVDDSLTIQKIFEEAEKISEEDDNSTSTEEVVGINKDLLDLIESIKKIKLEDNEDDDPSNEDNSEVLDYESKFDRPFHEGVILQLRQNDGEDIDDALNKNNDNIKLDTNSPDGKNLSDAVTKDYTNQHEKPVPYGDDGLNANKEETVVKSGNKETEINDKIEATDSNKNELIAKLTNETQLLKQYSDEEANMFVKNNFDEIFAEPDLNSDYPMLIQINYNENIPIMSPRYPDSYKPIDKTYEYVVGGDGMGIELNVTEVNINGAVNDFLLIKPGNFVIFYVFVNFILFGIFNLKVNYKSPAVAK